MAGKSKEGQENQCLACKTSEGPATPGATFTSNGDNGMIVTFWLCDPCALPLGPGQGPITLEDPSTRI